MSIVDRPFSTYESMGFLNEMPDEADFKEALISAVKAKKETGNIGGIQEMKNLPTLVIPDIHARPSLVQKALATKAMNLIDIDAPNAFSALQNGQINLVAIGDLPHSECSKIWNNVPVSPDNNSIKTLGMEEEMQKALRTWMMMARLQEQFPEQVFLVQGNHDDSNIDRHGYSVVKYGKKKTEHYDAWFKANVSKETRKALYAFEKNMALVVRNTQGLICSHTIGGESLSLEDIKNKVPEAEDNFCWADTDPTHLGTSEKGIEEQLALLAGKNDFLSIIGHRHTELSSVGLLGKDGKPRLVQVNSMDKGFITLVPKNIASFSVKKHVVDVGCL